jgi:hypothetical protein
VTVSAVTDSTHITVTSDAPGACPDATGVVNSTTKVSWFDPSGYPGAVIKTSVVANHTGSTGSVNLTLASPFAGIQVGDYIFPSCERAEEYAQAWLAAVGSMGPGEWTTDATVLADARRQPLATKEAPHTIGLSQRKALEQVGDEVLDVRYHYASSNVTYTPANTKTSAPYVLVPGRRLGFYPPK